MKSSCDKHLSTYREKKFVSKRGLLFQIVSKTICMALILKIENTALQSESSSLIR